MSALMKHERAVMRPVLRSNLRGGSSSAALVTYSAPWRDSFETPPGSVGSTITGRVIQSLTWAVEKVSGSNNDPIILAAGGCITGGQGVSPNVSHLVVQPPVTASGKVFTRKVGAGYNTTTTGYKQNITSDHFNLSGSLRTGVYFEWASLGNSGGLTIIPIVAGVTGTTLICNNVQLNAGDVIQTRYDASGFMNLFHNGRRVNIAQFDTVARAVPQTQKLQIRGDTTTNTYEGVEIFDPSTDAGLSLDHPNRIIQRQSNGDVIPNFYGEYWQGAPPGLFYSLIRVSTRAAVPGYADLPMQNFSAASNLWTGKGSTILAADLVAGEEYEWLVYRTDITGGGRAYAESPRWKVGDTYLGYGQSNEQNWWFSQTGVTLSKLADQWWADGTTVPLGGTTIDVNGDKSRRNNQLYANSPIQQWAYTMQAKLGTLPRQYIRGGRGGTYITERVPGQPDFDALADGVKRAGGDFLMMYDSGGENEANSGGNPTMRSNYVTNLDLIYDALKAQIGHDFMVGLYVIGTCLSLTASDVWDMAYKQYRMTVNNPSRYKLMPYRFHITHAVGNSLHPDDPGYVEIARLRALQTSFYQGNTADDRLGPYLVSGTRVSATRLDLVFNVANSAGLNNPNTAYANDHNGGIYCATSPIPGGARIAATSSSLSAVVGGLQTLTLNFPANTFPGTAYVQALYGNNPFNPTSDATITADYANKLSRWAGTYSGEPDIPIRPSWDIGGLGVHYLTLT